MSIEDLKVYKLAMEIGEDVWKIVSTWEYFNKQTIGRQWVDATDSIAANISEGYGRFHYKENIHFNYYSRGSLYESKTWLMKAKERKLITDGECSVLSEKMTQLLKQLNNYIRSIGTNPGCVTEDDHFYNNSYSDDIIN
jgi:four helix bundle protein